MSGAGAGAGTSVDLDIGQRKSGEMADENIGVNIKE